jgi:hypothetical protein
LNLHASVQLAARKELLVLRSAVLRAGLQQEGAVIGQKLHFVDRSVAYLRSRTGRIVIVGGAVLVLLVGPRRLLRIAPRMLIAWPAVRPLFWRYVRGVLRGRPHVLDDSGQDQAANPVY